MLGIIAGGREGFSATLFYASVYAVTLIGAFAVVGVVRRESGGDDLQNFVGFAARSPLWAANFGDMDANEEPVGLSSCRHGTVNPYPCPKRPSY